MPLTHSQLAAVQALRREAENLVEYINKAVEMIERTDEIDLLTTFHQLPTTRRLDEIESFGRGLTVDDVWKQASPQDRAYLCEVRCIISDAVLYARQVEYGLASMEVQRAMRKLAHIRSRQRLGKYAAMPHDVSAALVDATNILMEVIALFIEADNALTQNQGVLDGVPSTSR